MFSFLIFFSLLLLLPYQYPLKQPFFAVTFCDLIGDHDQNDTNQTLENAVPMEKSFWLMPHFNT